MQRACASAVVRAALLVALALALSPAGCKKHGPTTIPKVGDACNETGLTFCTGKKSAVVCVGGKYEAMPCRYGCSAWSDGHVCRNREYEPGEYCKVNPDDFFMHACSVDKKAELHCRSGRWAHEKDCRGKRGCRWIYVDRYHHGHDHIACDNVVIEPGAPCSPEERHACTNDDKAILVCRGGKWAEDQYCRGPKGCRKVGDSIGCDDTIAQAGDPCVDDGDQSCSLDRKSLLVCKSKKMVVEKPCKSGCTASSDKIRGTNPGARVECR